MSCTGWRLNELWRTTMDDGVSSRGASAKDEDRCLTPVAWQRRWSPVRLGQGRPRLTLWLRGRAFRDDPSSVDDPDPVGDASRFTALRVFARVEGRVGVASVQDRSHREELR